MEQEWSTEVEDMEYARTIMEQYAAQHASNSCELFELSVDKLAKRMEFSLARWVVVLAHHFFEQYGLEQGDFVVRQVIGKCMINGSTLH